MENITLWRTPMGIRDQLKYYYPTCLSFFLHEPFSRLFCSFLSSDPWVDFEFLVNSCVLHLSSPWPAIMGFSRRRPWLSYALLLFSSWLFVDSRPTANNASTQCTVRTGSASIQGHETAGTNVCEFLGIPYASPPVGQLRFSPPEPANNTGNFFAADTYGYDCPQNTASYFAYPNATEQYADVYGSFVNQLNNTQSEDCLTLNIWNKYDASTARKPVVMFIYGGRFSAGTSNTPFYRGDLLSQAQELVVVTFNFRMNIFGRSKDTLETIARHHILRRYMYCCTRAYQNHTRLPRIARDDTEPGLPRPICSSSMGS